MGNIGIIIKYKKLVDILSKITYNKYTDKNLLHEVH